MAPRRRLTFSLTLGFAFMILAPSGAASQMSLGIGGGIVSSNFTGDDAELADSEAETGISVGAWLAIPIANRVSVVPGAHYVQKGASFTEAGVGTASLTGSYLEIPLLLSVSLTPAESSVGFSVFAGPEVAFEMSCKISVSSGSASVSDDCDPADVDERQTLDIGALIGAGVQFPLNERVSLMFSGGADLGLRTLDTSADPADIKNRAFFGSVAVAFPIGG